MQSEGGWIKYFVKSFSVLALFSGARGPSLLAGVAAAVTFGQRRLPRAGLRNDLGGPPGPAAALQRTEPQGRGPDALSDHCSATATLATTSRTPDCSAPQCPCWNAERQAPCTLERREAEQSHCVPGRGQWRRGPRLLRGLCSRGRQAGVRCAWSVCAVPEGVRGVQSDTVCSRLHPPPLPVPHPNY